MIIGARPAALAGWVARQFAKPIYATYYRFLYGHSFPGSEALASRVRAFDRIGGVGDVPISQEQWEEGYRRGDWDFLAAPREVARYELLARQLRRIVAAGGRVLDVGSGEGILYQHIGDAGYRYTGVDISQTAIQKAQERWSPGADGPIFLAADAETYEPGEAAGRGGTQ